MEKNNKFISVLKCLFFGDKDIHFIIKNDKYCSKINYQSLLIVSLVSALLTLSLFIVGFFNTYYHDQLILNGVYFLICALIFFFCLFFLKKNLKYVLVTFFGFALVAYAYALISSLVYNENEAALAIYLLLVIIPFLVFTISLLNYIATGVVSVIYIISVFYLKSTPIAIRESIITVLVFFLSNIISSITIYQKVTSLKINLKVTQESDTDSLTGLPNKRSITLKLAEYSKADAKEYLSGVIMLDLDYFKAYNDHYGHLKGDQALCLVGNSLEEISKKYQIFIGRYGGEEFVCFVNFINLNNIKHIAEEIKCSIKKLEIEFANSPDENTKYLTISYGIAIRDLEDDPLDVLSNADIELYKAKQKNKIGFYSYSNYD
jgi:diguanylate cyclase (GGDEF) domain